MMSKAVCGEGWILERSGRIELTKCRPKVELEPKGVKIGGISLNLKGTSALLHNILQKLEVAL
jgi:hypothetical protein